MILDEDDVKLMVHVSSEVCARAQSVAVREWTSESATVRVSAGHSIQPELLSEFVDLVDTNLGKLYVKHSGNNWKENKRKEMSDEGLVYLWILDRANGTLMGFMSFKLCDEGEDATVLYLYEIHIVPQYKSLKYGGQLMDVLHSIAKDLTVQAGPWYFESCLATCLTVFTDNTMALQWYLKLGYQLHPGSPQDRKLRGKTIKPDYYILFRPCM
ncbi:Histone-specific N-acetyltransferase NAT4 [Scheffersomyces stipitis CBS 6054]|uniref:N-alpha-acetyltransferase 40 n=1 Tax=Scheffersomyces stipitis (strain ATCC 58785 / CBS 6054 / NBRC 10063 / NRRL Y-11545) TaxID=322104 RepID=A3GGD1_PICST|nr:Histone-specific N-acetyltransferase NAT4 [Scheffersomyces stipitis CBS 6054]EAZ63498.2 Histone-specific N-acetyltransferase NAT4 [Scheffersomyces stipitis CBS 6054]KAG2735166.1 hypothetical protein G9P44_001380 [Scheffersomyces stipitis]